MAKDDYHVIVYQILSYLYQRLKRGEQVDAKMLMHNSPLLNINRKYWAYIIYHMSESGLIEGISFIDLDGLDVPYAHEIAQCRITPLGIEYLCDNSFMEKAKRFIKEAADIITPFV